MIRTSFAHIWEVALSVGSQNPGVLNSRLALTCSLTPLGSVSTQMRSPRRYSEQPLDRGAEPLTPKDLITISGFERRGEFTFNTGTSESSANTAIWRTQSSTLSRCAPVREISSRVLGMLSDDVYESSISNDRAPWVYLIFRARRRPRSGFGSTTNEEMVIRFDSRAIEFGTIHPVNQKSTKRDVTVPSTP